MPILNKQNSSHSSAKRMVWDKSKLLQAILIPLAVVLIVFGIDYGITQVKLSQIPESLRINTDRDNIIGAQVIPQGKIYDKQDPTKVIYEGEVVKYAYKTDKIEDKVNEVVEKRTKHSRTVKVAEDNEKITYQLEVISGVPQYYEDEKGEWYQADYGTTDINTYSLETKGSVLANLFFPNKVYATEGTFYPDADPETSTVDGHAGRTVAGETFNSIRNGAGNFADDFSTFLTSRLDAVSTTDMYGELYHSILLFDSSSLGASANISSSIFSGYSSGKTATLGETPIHLAASTPASNTSIVNADYQQIGRTSFGSITYANLTASQYNDITLNASGLSNISKTGISKFSLQLEWDINNNFTGTWSDTARTAIDVRSAEAAGTSQDPKLVVTYTVPLNPKQDVIWFD